MNITIGTIVTLVIAGIIIRFATKFAMKLIGWVLIIGLGAYLMYHFGVGPFKTNPISISTWEQKYCADPQQKLKCDCIVRPVRADLESRFSPEELKTLEQDRAQLLYAIQKSFSSVKPQIVLCLGEENAEKQLSEFRNDLIPIDNDILEELNKLKKTISETANEKLDEFKSSKEEIDKKYED